MGGGHRLSFLQGPSGELPIKNSSGKQQNSGKVTSATLLAAKSKFSNFLNVFLPLAAAFPPSAPLGRVAPELIFVISACLLSSNICLVENLKIIGFSLAYLP